MKKFLNVGSSFNALSGTAHRASRDLSFEISPSTSWFEALCVRFSKDQAANPDGVLAWSYAQSRVFDPPSVEDANA